MLMTEIRTQSFSAVDSAVERIASLAQQASELLGYNVLGKTVTLEMTELQLALKDLEIEILVPSDVLIYQKERQLEQTKENFAKWARQLAEKTEIGRFMRFDGPAWVEEKIAEYKQPIPEFVLAKAVQIKQRVPECEIYIESLQDHPDPFLVVAIPDERKYYPAKERYYIEVWAEPKFEGRL